MSRLSTTPAAQPDAVFEALSALYDGLAEAETERAVARLLLLLANHIGDAAVIRDAVRLARAGLGPRDDRPAPPGGML